MSDKPILFSAPMIRALLDGRKVQTRRVQTPPYGTLEYLADGTWKPIFPGDRLWVRETWASGQKHIVAYRADGECGAWCWDGDGKPMFIRHGKVMRPEDNAGNFGLAKYGDRWRSPIHMPRWASRLTLTVTDVRVQRVQEISDEDAEAEGVEPVREPGRALVYWRDYSGDCPRGFLTARRSFQSLWDSIHQKRPGTANGWAANPWVVAITFTVHRANIDRMEAA